MAGVSGGGSESNAQNESNAGLQGDAKRAFQPTAINTGNQANALANQYAQSPYGYFQGQSTQQLLDVDPNTGLPRSATQYLGSMANQAMANFSAGGSTRGQWSPENTPNIVGGALMGMAGQLLPLQTDYSKFMAGLPDQLMNSRLGYLNSVGSNNAALLGSSSRGESGASSMNFGAQVCWVAGVLYGEGSHEQQSIRQWLRLQTSYHWKTFVKLYVAYGQQVARFLVRYPKAQRLVRPLFNHMLRQAHG